MKRLLLTVAALLGLTTPASAATLTIEADHAAYHVGDTITLSINGDAQGATAFGVYGRLLFNGALVNNGTRIQEPLGPGWTLGNLGAEDSDLNAADSAYAEALNQINLDGLTQSAANPISTVTLIAQAPGSVEVIWDVVNTGVTLDFFGLTSAPGVSFAIADVTTTTTVPTSTSSSTTTTTLPGNDIECGDLDGSGSIVASDALLLLKRAIGAEVPSLECPGTCPTTTSSNP